MATCDLKVELDDSDVARADGKPVTGTVIVTTSEAVKCKGLEVTSYWGTHGRGNIDTGDVDQSVLFEGQWEPQREYRYKFSLKTAAWPPTYYGTYLNVSHWVKARARVPWATDPKVEAEYIVVATNAPDDLKPTESDKKKSGSIVGWVIGWVVGGIFLVIFGALFSMLLLFLLPLAAIGGAGYWFFKVFLPRQFTGSIECSLQPQKVKAGETAKGTLRFTPKRQMTINAIQWNVKCIEKCVSGSGSNRSTHEHEIFTKSDQLVGATSLGVGQPQSFEFSFAAPRSAPPSLKFGNNELIWSGELRIDIPKWPDYVQTFPLTVVSSGITESMASSGGSPMLPPGSPLGPSGSGMTAEEEKWFLEVVEQIEESEGDNQRMEMVLSAVREHVFKLRLDIVRRLDQPPESAKREPGDWAIARYRSEQLDLALFFPSSVEPPAPGTFGWNGEASFIGYDDELACPLMRVRVGV